MKKIEFFKVEGDRINRIRKHCPKCGPAVFLADHKNRFSCGKCGYAEFKGGGRPQKPPKTEDKTIEQPKQVQIDTAMDEKSDENKPVEEMSVEKPQVEESGEKLQTEQSHELPKEEKGETEIKEEKPPEQLDESETAPEEKQKKESIEKESKE